MSVLSKIDDISIKAKVVCLSALSCTTIVGLSAVGYIGMDKADKNIGNIDSGIIQPISESGEAKFLLKDMQTRNLIAMYAPSRANEAHEELKKMDASYQEKWRTYKSSLGKDSSEQMKKTESDYTEFYETIDKSLSLIENGKTDDGIKLYNEKGGKLIQTVREDITALEKTTLQNSKAMQEESETQTERYKHIMLIVSAISMILAVLIGLIIVKSITASSAKVIGKCKKMNDKDFRQEKSQSFSNDEFGQIQKTFHDLTETMQNTMGKIKDSSSIVASSSEELMASSQQSAQASQQVAQSITETVAVVNEQNKVLENMEAVVSSVSKSTNELQEYAKKVTKEAKETSGRAGDGMQSVNASVASAGKVKDAVQSSTDTMLNLGKRSEEIGKIITAISKISKQTNLLALNAAIEASHAGDAGHGFAVVAENIRKLAEESQDAAKSIEEMIQGMQEETKKAISSMQSGNKSVTESVATIRQMNELFIQIKESIDHVSDAVSKMSENIGAVAENTAKMSTQANNMAEQSRKVSEAMESVSAATEEQSASSEEIASSANALANLADDLLSEVGKFKL